MVQFGRESVFWARGVRNRASRVLCRDANLILTFGLNGVVRLPLLFAILEMSGPATKTGRISERVKSIIFFESRSFLPLIQKREIQTNY